MSEKIRSQYSRLFARRAKRRAKLSQTCVVALGGSGDAVSGVGKMLGWLRANILKIDTDISMLEDAAFEDQLHLSGGGNMEGILKNKPLFPLISGKAVPDYATGFESDWGVGMVRLATMILLAFNLNEVRSRIRKLLQRTLDKFEGRQPKHLDIHLVFSLAGGSGSAMAIIVAALILDAARSLAPTLNVTIRGHAFGPRLFTGLAVTPDAEQRVLANTGITIRELHMATQPQRMKKLSSYLKMDHLNRPLFSEIDYYEATDSGSGLHSLEDVSDLVATNIVAADNPTMMQLQKRRSVNPLTAQRGNGSDDFGSSIIGCTASRVARIPIEKLADAWKALTLCGLLRDATNPATDDEVKSQVRPLLDDLRLDSTIRDLQTALRPDKACFLQSGDVRLTTPEIITSANRADQRWSRRGIIELRQRAQRVGADLSRKSLQRVQSLQDSAAKMVHSVPHYTALLREILEAVVDRRNEINNRLEKMATIDRAKGHRDALERLQTPVRWGKAKRRQAMILAHNAMVEDASRESAYRTYCESFLRPAIDSLTAEISRLGELEGDLNTISQQIELELENAQSEIGHENAYFSEVITPAEVPRVLDSLSKYIHEQFGAPVLNLGQLITCRSISALHGMIEDAGVQFDDQVNSFLSRVPKDIHGFVRVFKLSFDLQGWLDESMQLTLPAKLNLAVVPAGSCPLRSYLIGPSGLPMIDSAVKHFGGDLNIEIREAEDPFQITLCAQIARAPFASIPGLVEIDRAFFEFIATAPKDRMWGVLVSHADAFADALNIQLTVPDHASAELEAA